MTRPSPQSSVQPKQRSQSLLSSGLEKNLSAYAIAAGSAGVALLACVQPADAKVVATKTNILVTVGNPVQLDINGDGQIDFTVSATARGVCTTSAARHKPGQHGGKPLGCGNPFYDALRLLPGQAADEAWAAATSVGFKCAADVARGVPIGPQRPFAEGTLVMSALTGTSEGIAFCPWSRNHYPYLGVKFTDTTGNVHYGWIRVLVRLDYQPVIQGYAYETVPNKPIGAGIISGPVGPTSQLNPSDFLAPQAAEPATLGRLAQGASGLSAWRRENEVVAA
jgi:hypothetical protein